MSASVENSRISTRCCRCRGRCILVDRGQQGLLTSIKYVITLDTDTQLPRDSAGNSWVPWLIH
jgi:hypothetical protein